MNKLPKITLSEVFKKDLKVFAFLLVNGLAAYVALQLEANPTVSLIIGAALNYVVFRINQELDKSGYIKALKK